MDIWDKAFLCIFQLVQRIQHSQRSMPCSHTVIMTSVSVQGTEVLG